MESLLAVSFDNISSRDSFKIRKGLRQIDGLLAQICLSSSLKGLSPQKRKSSVLSDSAPKLLGELQKDAAFREFFRLQESFQWNVASRLVTALERLMGMGNPSQTDLVILSTLDILQGVLLLHPPSKCLFGREIYMNLILDLLDSTNPPRVQSAALLVLVTALLECSGNTRVFEEIDGLLTVTSLFKSKESTKEVRMRVLEFLYFYLMPERAGAGSSAPNSAVLQRPPAKLQNVFTGHLRAHSGEHGSMAIDQGEASETKTMEEKQNLLGRYLNNVDELVQDLQGSLPFSTIAR